MVPSGAPGNDDAHQGSSGKMHGGKGGENQPEHAGSGLATPAASLSTPDSERVPEGKEGLAAYVSTSVAV